MVVAVAGSLGDSNLDVVDGGAGSDGDGRREVLDGPLWRYMMLSDYEKLLMRLDGEEGDCRKRTSLCELKLLERGHGVLACVAQLEMSENGLER